MGIFSNRVNIRIIVVLLFLFFVSITGCGSENNQTTERSSVGPFPENYIAEDYPLPDDFLAISASTVRDNIFYFSVIKDISGNQTYDADTAELVGELRCIDFSAESASPVTVLYEDINYIVQIISNNDGTLDLVTQSYGGMKGFGAPEVTETLIKKISLSGEELLSYSIMEDVKNQEYISITDFITDTTGNAYVLIWDTLYVWNAASQLLYTTEIPGSLSHMSQSLDGTVYLIWLGIDGFQIAPVDIETGTLERRHTLSSGQVYLDMAAGINSDLLLATSDGIYEYDTEQWEEKKIISFSQLGIPADFGGKLLPLSNDRIAWLQAENNENTLTVIRGAKEAEILQKKTLILGGTVRSFYLWHHKAVANFNRISPDVRIEIKIYGSNEINDGTDDLNMDIANGQGPDIIILPRQFSMDLYTRKEVLTDLYPYIDGDEEMERSDFQENILRAYETDGKLFGIPIVYWISTMAAPKSATGDINQWNLDEMIAFAERYMPDSTVFSEANKSNVLNLCLKANGDCLIDWSNEGQGFQRELFIKMLLFSDRFVSDNTYTYDERLIQRIQDDRQIQIMCHESITGFLKQQVYLEAFREQLSYLGYPSENGNGNLIDSNFVMAINSACDDKDAAWQFINSLLSEEFQWSLADGFAFPIRKNVLEQKIESEMKIYETEENGIKKEEKRDTYNFGADKIDIYAAREEDIQTVLAIINSADKIRIWNGQINNIIYEEAGAFFNGSKTVEEVADIAENRIQIYINEMK